MARTGFKQFLPSVRPVPPHRVTSPTPLSAKTELSLVFLPHPFLDPKKKKDAPRAPGHVVQASSPIPTWAADAFLKPLRTTKPTKCLHLLDLRSFCATRRRGSPQSCGLIALANRPQWSPSLRPSTHRPIPETSRQSPKSVSMSCRPRTEPALAYSPRIRHQLFAARIRWHRLGTSLRETWS